MIPGFDPTLILIHAFRKMHIRMCKQYMHIPYMHLYKENRKTREGTHERKT